MKNASVFGDFDSYRAAAFWRCRLANFKYGGMEWVYSRDSRLNGQLGLSCFVGKTLMLQAKSYNILWIK